MPELTSLHQGYGSPPKHCEGGSSGLRTVIVESATCNRQSSIPSSPCVLVRPRPESLSRLRGRACQTLRGSAGGGTAGRQDRARDGGGAGHRPRQRGGVRARGRARSSPRTSIAELLAHAHRVHDAPPRRHRRPAIAALAADVGPIDVLFNCAGIVHAGTVLDCTDADWDQRVCDQRHGDVPHHPRVPARDARARRRLDHQHVVGGLERHRRPQPLRLRRQQGGGGRHHQVGRRRFRRQGHPLQRDLPGHGGVAVAARPRARAGRGQRPAGGRRAGRVRRPPADGPPGPAGGNRGAGGLPRVGRIGLHHRARSRWSTAGGRTDGQSPRHRIRRGPRRARCARSPALKGHSVDTCRGALEVLQEARFRPLDVVVTDRRAR